MLLKGRPWKPDEIALILVREGGWGERGSYERGDKALLVAARPSQDQAGTSRDQRTKLSCFLCVSRLMPHQDTADPAARRHGRTCSHAGQSGPTLMHW